MDDFKIEILMLMKPKSGHGRNFIEGIDIKRG